MLLYLSEKYCFLEIPHKWQARRVKTSGHASLQRRSDLAESKERDYTRSLLKGAKASRDIVDIGLGKDADEIILQFLIRQESGICVKPEACRISSTSGGVFACSMPAILNLQRAARNLVSLWSVLRRDKKQEPCLKPEEVSREIREI